MNLDFESEQPIYIQIAEEIKDAILSGSYKEETQVPSTTEISISYKINPATVLKGMTILVNENILYKKRGVGMFVSTGAAEKILTDRQKNFYNNYIINLLNEANKLKIDKTTIIKLIESGEFKNGN